MIKSAEAVIAAYNRLAIAMPVEAWSGKFAHPRMERRGPDGEVHLQYHVWRADIRNYVPEHLFISGNKVAGELQRLRGRAQRTGLQVA